MQKFTAKKIAESNATYLVDDIGLSEQDLLRAVLALLDFGEFANHTQERARVAINTAIRALDVDDRTK